MAGTVTRQLFRSLYSKKVILDSNILFDLQELKCLDLPIKIFQEAYVSKNALLEEFSQQDVDQIIKLGYIPEYLKTNDGYSKLFYLNEKYPQLSTPDKVVICIAFEKNIICCTNDGNARKACNNISVALSGTLGILCCAFEHKIIDWDKFVSLFNSYGINTSAHVSDELRDEIRRLYNIPSSTTKVFNINIKK